LIYWNVWISKHTFSIIQNRLFAFFFFMRLRAFMTWRNSLWNTQNHRALSFTYFILFSFLFLTLISSVGCFTEARPFRRLRLNFQPIKCLKKLFAWACKVEVLILALNSFQFLHSFVGSEKTPHLNKVKTWNIHVK